MASFTGSWAASGRVISRSVLSNNASAIYYTQSVVGQSIISSVKGTSLFLMDPPTPVSALVNIAWPRPPQPSDGIWERARIWLYIKKTIYVYIYACGSHHRFGEIWFKNFYLVSLPVIYVWFCNNFSKLLCSWPVLDLFAVNMCMNVPIAKKINNMKNWLYWYYAVHEWV